jgi:alpha-1,6-mannosyltransferase
VKVLGTLPLAGSVAALLVLGALNAAALLWGSHGGSNMAPAARELLAVLLAHGAGAAALMWIAFDRRLAHTPVAWVLLTALALRLAVVLAAPLLEDDHYRYLWDGLRTATTLDPYTLPPEAYFGDHTLAARWLDVLSGINHPELPTIYGPLLQALFALAHVIAPAELVALQALLLLVDMAVLALLARWPVGVRWLWAYALHPLVLKEALASAHPDGVLALLLLACAWAWQRGAPLRLGLLLGAALATKVAAWVVLPLLLIAPGFAHAPAAQRWRWTLSVLAGGVAGLAIWYAPFLWAGGSDAAALQVFGQQWRFNPLLFRAIEPWGHAARPLAALVVVAVVAVLAWRCLLRPAPAGRCGITAAMAGALLALLLCSPVVNPWYWLWVLPLALAAGQTCALVAGVVAVLSYLNGHVLPLALPGVSGLPDMPFQVPVALALVQLLAIAAALSWDFKARATSVRA